MVGILETLSTDLASIAESVGPSVARVSARKRLPASGVVWSGDGVIVTTHHVVEREDGIKVGLADGGDVKAALVGRDPTTDVAVLKAEASGLAAPRWADAGDLKVGHIVLGLGRPGKSVRAALGIVSALGPEWRTPAGGAIDAYLQSDVVMYPGFSGGALATAGGAVAGINTSAVLRGSTVTIPTGTLRRVVETLLAHGKVKRGYLGIGTHMVRLPEDQTGSLGQETGLLVGSVEKSSPAEQGGVLLGDVIVGIDGEGMTTLDGLLGFLNGDRIGRRSSVKVIRGGVITDVGVTVGERG